MDTEDKVFTDWCTQMVGRASKITELKLDPNSDLVLKQRAIAPLHFYAQAVENSENSNIPRPKDGANMLLAVQHKINKNIPDLYKMVTVSLNNFGPNQSVTVQPNHDYVYDKQEYAKMCDLARDFGGRWNKEFRMWIIPVKE